VVKARASRYGRGRGNGQEPAGVTRGFVAGAVWGVLVGALVIVLAALAIETRRDGPVVPPEDPVAAVPAPVDLAALRSRPARDGAPERRTAMHALRPLPEKPALPALAGRPSPRTGLSAPPAPPLEPDPARWAP